MGDVQEFSAQAPGVAKIASLIERFVQDDAALRKIQANNAPQAFGFQQETVVDTAVRSFTAAQSDQIFTVLVVIVESTAGSGRYRVDGGDPTAAGVGIEIPAGGTVLEIPGYNNLRNFRIIAATGQSMPLVMQGFR